MLLNAVGLVAVLVVGATPQPQLVVELRRDGARQPPPGFSTALTGGGGPVAWVVQEDPLKQGAGKVLVQTSADSTSYRFPLCVADSFSAKDVNLSVRFAPISGKVDRAAGLVWRYRDADNYYVVRANALEGNVVLYKVEGGKRTDLKPTDAGWLAYGVKTDGAERHVERAARRCAR